MTKVDIGKKVNYETLENALIQAAKEVGWKANVHDDFRKGYKLGSVEEVQEYNGTTIYLRGRLRSAMQIKIFNKDSRDWFHICTGFGCGSASKRRVRRYLEAVSNLL